MPDGRVAPAVTLLVAAAGAVSLACAVPERRAAEPAEFRQVHMGMEVRMLVNATRPQADSIADRAFARIAELEAILSDWNPQSELRRLESVPVAEWVTVSTALRDVLALALDIARATDGAFDPTVGPLTALWRESARTNMPIADSARSRVLRSVGYTRVELDTAASAVRFLRPGMRLDLGGIAKGWILDEALREIAPDEVGGVLIEAGGDIVTRGVSASDAPWRIAVRSGARDSSIVVRDAAISTSSTIAQQSVPRSGPPEGHVFRTTDGRGATDSPQITLLGTRAAVTDALATAMPLMSRAHWTALTLRYGVRVVGVVYP